MFQLNKLTSLTKKRKRIGRGGSRGGTAGRGTKGQKARTGHSRNRISFEGGQMPLVRRLPKRGFNNKNFSTQYHIINLSLLENSFEPNQTVNKESMVEKGLIKHKHALVKILGKGSLTKKLMVHADAFSVSAQDAIKQCGGEIYLIKEM